MGRIGRWLHGPLLALLLVLGSGSVALACGIYIPSEGDGVITQERALIRFVDGVEDIVMELSVSGESTSAAWILPVPNPAQVTLADDAIFTELALITAPKVETRYIDPDLDGAVGSAPPTGAGVTIYERQTLGPFDVVSLAGDDADAVAAWLAGNDFAFPDALPAVIAPYIEDDWAFVAVSLRPGAMDQTLGGQLTPLNFQFATDEIVYPLRPAALGEGDRPLFLYVLADGKVEPAPLTSVGNDTRLQYADAISPESLAEDTVLAPWVTEPLYLTKYNITLWDVTDVAEDLYFVAAADDEPFRDTTYEYVTAAPGVGLQLPNCAWLPTSLFAAGIFVAKRRKVASQQY